MDKTVNLSFDYMLKDRPVAHVEVLSDGTIRCERFTEDVMDNPLPFGNTPEGLEWFWKSRCFPPTRDGVDDLLKLLGLKYYSPLGIVRKTRGQQNDDFYWVRFAGDTVSYQDIKLRD